MKLNYDVISTVSVAEYPHENLVTLLSNIVSSHRKINWPFLFEINILVVKLYFVK